MKSELQQEGLTHGTQAPEGPLLGRGSWEEVRILGRAGKRREAGRTGVGLPGDEGS